MSQTRLVAHRAPIAHCGDNAGVQNSNLQQFADGLLLVKGGKVEALGPADALLPTLGSDVEIVDHGQQVLLPGFIDCHVHYPQVDVIASYGTQLLEWLENYTFPTEAKFDQAELATQTANFFCDELLKNGTTSALVFATVHPGSVDALFQAAVARNMRLAAGKVLMDRHCPENLRDDADSAYTDSKVLIEKWHLQDRLHYAITPRFAITSSSEQLHAAGRLAAEYPDTLVHTHLAENRDEVKWIAELFPTARSYLDVYCQHNLVRERSVFAHCIHLDDTDYQTLSDCGGAMAFCPSSNLFLGSGLFDLARSRSHNINVGFGTDVGGGTSLSLLQTAADGYKVLQLNGQSLASADALYLATLGAAKTLGIDHKVGNFAVGKEADFVLLDPQPTALMSRRLSNTADMLETLFVHMTLGDDRSIAATYLMGEAVYQKGQIA